MAESSAVDVTEDPTEIAHNTLSEVAVGLALWKASSAGTVYLGGADVTPATGLPWEGQTFACNVRALEQIFACADAGVTIEVRAFVHGTV